MTAHDEAAALEQAVAYHRMARLRPEWSRPAKPLLAVGAALLTYVLLISVVLVGTVLILALVPGGAPALGATSGDPASPLDVGLALLMGAAWLPAGIVGVRVGGWRPLGTAWSVTSMFRRDLLRWCAPWVLGGGLLVVAAAAVAGALAGSVDTGADGGAADGAALAASAGPTPLAAVALVLLVLVLAPVQAAGLELVLRGLVLQAAGTWLRAPVAALLPVLAVVLIGRDLTPAVLLPALTAALCSGVLAWRSGGLELPIALSTVLTIAALLTAAFGAGTGAGAGIASLVAGLSAPGTSGTAPDAAGSSAALAGAVAGTIALLLVTVGLMVLLGRREGTGPLCPTLRDATSAVPSPLGV